MHSKHILSLPAAALLALTATAQEETEATHFTPHVRSIHGLESPSGLAYGPAGLLWIVEQSADRVRAFDAEGVEQKRLGGRGSGAGELIAPSDVAVAADGTVFVVDTGNHRICRFDASGASAGAWGAWGNGPGEFHYPTGVDVREDRVAVADSGGDRVQVFDVSGKHLMTAGRYGHGDGELARPVQVAFADDGGLYVSDGDHHRVVRFDADGKHATAWGEWGYFPGLFSSPAGIEVWGGRVFVADVDNHRVQVYTPDGDLIYRFGLHAIRPREGRGRLHYPVDVAVAADGSRVAIAEPYDDRVQILGRAPGEEPDEPIGGIGQPAPHYGFQIDLSGQLGVIVEPETHTVGVYDLRIDVPVRIGMLGGFGRTLGLFNRPTGCAIDEASQKILVCDTAGRRLHEARLGLDLEAELRQYPELGDYVKMLDFEALGRAFAEEPLEFTVRPIAVQIAQSGEVFVLDGGNERVFVFGDDLAFRRSFGGHGGEREQLSRPTDMELSPDEKQLFVVDSQKGRIVAFSVAGEMVADIGVEELQEPFDVTFDANGRMFVTDVRRHQVLRFADGKLEHAWGKRGIQRMHFLKPRGLAFDGKGRLLVIDHGNHRGTIMSADGEYEGSFGSRFYTKPARRPELYKPEDYVE
ncbi:MAG: hypothetical protein GY711_25930 [bacterium]|nr:hypothetical protein [bacterium]